MGRTDLDNTEIAYQNKDITSKVLAENFKGKTFRVYGLDLPEIEQVLPTNLPTVKANELVWITCLCLQTEQWRSWTMKATMTRQTR